MRIEKNLYPRWYSKALLKFQFQWDWDLDQNHRQWLLELLFRADIKTKTFMQWKKSIQSYNWRYDTTGRHRDRDPGKSQIKSFVTCGLYLYDLGPYITFVW